MKLGKPPTEALGYRVTVVPGIQERACWDFYILLPKDEKAPDAVIKDVCTTICEENDVFVYRTMDFEFDNDLTLPILSFSPDHPDELHWICPPEHWKN